MNMELVSDLAQRVGWTLVHSVWQFAIIAAFLAVTLGLVRRRSSHVRYALMLIAMMAMVVVPAMTLFVVGTGATVSAEFVANNAIERELEDVYPASPAGRDPSAINLTDSRDGQHKVIPTSQIELAVVPMPATGANAHRLITTALPNFIQEWMNAIVAVWLIGIAVLSIRLLVGWRAIRTLRVSGRLPVAEPIETIASRVAQQLGIRRAIEVAQSSLVDVPTVIGWLKPLVLLPASAISGLSSEQLEAVIAHELAHVRRYDYVVNVFQVLMETVFFYHPAVWWTAHLMRVERESCCDDIAILMTGDRVRYARLLVWLEEARGPSAPMTLAMSAGSGSLSNRIARIVGSRSKATGIGPLTSTAILAFVTGVGCFLVADAGNSTAQETKAKDADKLRAWMTRAVELEEWGRLSQLAREMAEAGEYDEALDWLSKAPLGKSREGKLEPKFYYRVVAEICETALEHDRLDFAMGVLDRLNEPKEYPSGQGYVRNAILTYYLSKGQIDQAIGFLESQPEGTRPSIANKAVERVALSGHGDHAEAFWRRLTDAKVLKTCEHELAYGYYRLHQPDKIWRFGGEIAKSRPDDLAAEVRVLDMAMHKYALMSWGTFEQRLPGFRTKVAKLADDNRAPYEKQLALYAANGKHYELAVELSTRIPLLVMGEFMAMDLSGADRHPVLYSITELHKQNRIEQAFSIVDLVEDETVKLASLSRLADLVGFGDGLADHQEIFDRIVGQLTPFYERFAQQHDEATVRDIERNLPEFLSLHLQRVSKPTISPDDVPYLNRELLPRLSQSIDLLIEQGHIDQIESHVEKLLDDRNINGSKWIVTKLAAAGHTDAVERLRKHVKLAYDKESAIKSKSSESIWDYRRFLAVSALTAYSSGERDLCYELFLKLDRNWMSPSFVSRVAYRARESGDMEFLRRMESSPSPLMREAALASLAMAHVDQGDMKAIEDTTATFEREFGEKNQHWSIYRQITDDRAVKDPSKRFVATSIAMQRVPLDSPHYAPIARDHAKLLGQLYPDKPLSTEWLAKLNADAKLRLHVEIEHAAGVRSSAVAAASPGATRLSD
ncbi:M56 family metallopeptidase [Stieleria varia]|uniref:Regulatory protein BlaR1 n=1 Tax=Stieleria varia TaxID=2528005 RepID=A0A5C6B8N4_9BACT|nr:M56 family metallopeptidase [Stieleria varia]TWU07801.1 Regulatory protein BlaR1 [Stieleria varia]